MCNDLLHLNAKMLKYILTALKMQMSILTLFIEKYSQYQLAKK